MIAKIAVVFVLACILGLFLEPVLAAVGSMVIVTIFS